MSKPTLYVVMGPSGAGKSTFGQKYVPVPIFNADIPIVEMQKDKHLTL